MCGRTDGRRVVDCCCCCRLITRQVESRQSTVSLSLAKATTTAAAAAACSSWLVDSLSSLLLLLPPSFRFPFQQQHRLVRRQPRYKQLQQQHTNSLRKIEETERGEKERLHACLYLCLCIYYTLARLFCGDILWPSPIRKIEKPKGKHTWYKRRRERRKERKEKKQPRPAQEPSPVSWFLFSFFFLLIPK